MSEVVVKFTLFVIILAVMLPVVGLAYNVTAYIVGKSEVPLSTTFQTFIQSFEYNYMNTIIKMSRDENTGEISVEAFFKNFAQSIYNKAESAVKELF